MASSELVEPIFKLCNILSKLSSKLKVSNELMGVFYGAYCASALNANTFDALVFYDLLKTKLVKWDDNYPNKPENLKEKSLNDIYTPKLKEKELELYDGELDLQNAKFIGFNSFGSKQCKKPSELPVFDTIQSIFDLLTNTIYISNKFYKWKSRRMQFGNSDLNISGPFKEDTPIKDIDALQSVTTLLKKIGIEKNITIGQLAEISDSKGGGDYLFVGINSSNQKNTNKSEEDSDTEYDIIDSKGFGYWSSIEKDNYAVFSNQVFEKTEGLINASVKMYKDIGQADTAASTMMVNFTRSKRPLDEEDDDKSKKQEEADADRQAKLDEASEKISEIYERFDIRYFKIISNQANGDPLRPISLNVKNGKIREVQALEKYSFSSNYSSAGKLKSSSKTVLGIDLPINYDITLNSISLNLSGDGVTTTISQSTSKLLPIDDSMVIDSGMKAQLMTAISRRMSAGQRNALRL